MENRGMENEEKKQGKHIYANLFIYLFVCHSLATFLASYFHQNQKTNKFRT